MADWYYILGAFFESPLGRLLCAIPLGSHLLYIISLVSFSLVKCTFCGLMYQVQLALQASLSSRHHGRHLQLVHVQLVLHASCLLRLAIHYLSSNMQLRVAVQLCPFAHDA